MTVRYPFAALSMSLHPDDRDVFAGRLMGNRAAWTVAGAAEFAGKLSARRRPHRH